jgi:hypothetical protein
MVNWFLVFQAIPRLLLFTLPFLSLYVLSRRFSRYYPTRPYLFYAVIAFSAAGFVFLSVELVLAVVSIQTVLFRSPLSDMNALFFFVSGLSLYVLSSNMEKAISGDTDNFHDLSSFVTFMLFLALFCFMIFSGLVQETSADLAAIDAMKAAVGLSAFFLLALSFLRMADIYKRLKVHYYYLLLLAAFLVGWQFFMVMQRWVSSVFDGLMISGTPVRYALMTLHLREFNLSVTIATILLASLPSVPMLVSFRKEARIRYVGAYSSFINGMSSLIGGSAVTILVNGLESYNRTYGTSITFDRERNRIEGEMTDEVSEYLVSYFENLIGPVARRVYAESIKGNRVLIRGEDKV